MDDSTYFTIDFGVNFADPKKYPNEKITKLMEESLNRGVAKVVSISNSIEEAKLNLVLAQQHENLHFTLGIHPHDARNYKDDDLKIIEDNLDNSKCFGVGECGLDFDRNYSPPEKQIEVFELQVQLAKKHGAKLYMHCRDAFDELIEILKKHEYYNGIVHCFTGTLDQALELTGLGFKLGITGWLLDKRRNQDLVEAVKDERITLDMLIVETDAPWLRIDKKKESVPANTYHIVPQIARLKGLDEVQCGKTLYKNALAFLTNK